MPQTPTTRKERAERTEAELKQAAVRVFARQGYLNSRITDITQEAGRAAGSFYSHFSGKEALLESLLTDMLAAGSELAAGHPDDHDLADPAHLRFHIAAFWHTFRANTQVFTALLQASLVDERFARRLRELMEPNARIMREHLEYVRDSGIRLPGDPTVVASAMTGMWMEFAHTWLAGTAHAPRREIADEEAIDTLTEFTLRGIAGTPQRR